MGNLPQNLTKALKELWQGSGRNWEGLGNGIAAGAQGIPNALEKVDEIVRRFEMSAEELQTLDLGAKGHPGRNAQ